MSKLLKIFLYSFITILIFLSISILILTSSPGESLVKNWLEQKLTDELSMQVSMHSFETNLWSEVTIDTLKIQDSANLQNEPLVYVGKIELAYSLWNLIGNNKSLKNIAIDSLAVSISSDSLNRLGIPLIDNPQADEKIASEEPINFSIDNITISRMALTYHDSKLPLKLQASGANLTIAGSSTDDYNGHLHISTIGTIYNTLPITIQDFDLDASLNKKLLTINQLQADCEGLALDAHGTLQLDNDSILFISNIQGNLDSLTEKLAHPYELTLSGNGMIDAQTEISGTIKSPTILSTANISSLNISETQLNEIFVQAQFQNNTLKLDTLSLQAFEGTINGHASTSINDSSLTKFEVSINNIDIAKLWMAGYANVSPYRGTVQGTIAASGVGSDYSNWKCNVDLSGNNLFYENKQIPDLACIATLDSGKSILSISHGADSIFAEIQLLNDSLSGTYTLVIPKILNFSRMFDMPDIQGSVMANGTVHGTMSNPKIVASLQGSNIFYQHFPIENLNSSLTYTDSLLTINQLSFYGSLDSIDASNPPFGIDSIQGALTYRGELSGSLENLIGNITSQIINPVYGTYKADSLIFVSKIEGSQIDISNLSLYQNNLQANLNGNFNIASNTGNFAINLLPIKTDIIKEDSTQDNFERTEFGTIKGDIQLDSTFNIQSTINGKDIWLGLLPLLEIDSTITSGNMNFNLSINGTMQSPDAELTANFQSVNVTEYIIDSLFTKASFHNLNLQLDSLISYTHGQKLLATAQLELVKDSTGTFQINKDGNLRAEVDMQNFNLSVLQNILVPDGSLAGTISTSLKVNGSLSNPRLNGWLNTTDGLLVFSDSISPIEEVSMSLTFNDSIITIDSAKGLISKIPVTAQGSIATSQFKTAILGIHIGVGKLGKLAINGSVSESNINLNISADSLNVQVFQPFAPDINTLTGRLSSKAKINGTLPNPNIDGTLFITSLTVLSRKNNLDISNGFASVRFDKQKVNIDSITASLNGGKMNLSGTVSLNGGELSDIELLLNAEKLKFVDSSAYSILVDSASIKYGKQKDTYVLSGDVVLGEVRFTKGLRPTSVLPWVQTLETVDLELPDLIARTKLDIRIRESNQLWVDNNLAHIRLRSELIR